MHGDAGIGDRGTAKERKQKTNLQWQQLYTCHRASRLFLIAKTLLHDPQSKVEYLPTTLS